MCSKGGPDMAATDSPGGPQVLPQTVWGGGGGGGGGGLHILPQIVWGDQLKYDRTTGVPRPQNYSISCTYTVPWPHT